VAAFFFCVFARYYKTYLGKHVVWKAVEKQMKRSFKRAPVEHSLVIFSFRQILADIRLSWLR
jgi:hypothetical protein